MNCKWKILMAIVLTANIVIMGIGTMMDYVKSEPQKQYEPYIVETEIEELEVHTVMQGGQQIEVHTIYHAGRTYDIFRIPGQSGYFEVIRVK